jgi:hypothetical protein
MKKIKPVKHLAHEERLPFIQALQARLGEYNREFADIKKKMYEHQLFIQLTPEVVWVLSADACQSSKKFRIYSLGTATNTGAHTQSYDRERKERDSSARLRLVGVELSEISIDSAVAAIADLFGQEDVWQHVRRSGATTYTWIERVAARGRVADAMQLLFDDEVAKRVRDGLDASAKLGDLRVTIGINYDSKISVSVTGLDTVRALNVIGALQGVEDV